MGPRASFEKRKYLYPTRIPTADGPSCTCLLYCVGSCVLGCVYGILEKKKNNNNNNTGAITGHSEAKQPDKRFAVAAPSSERCTEQRNRRYQYSLSSAPPFPKEHCFLEGSQAWLVCPFGRQCTQSLSVIKTRQLMLFREIIAVCSQIHTKHVNTLCGQNVELLNLKPVKFFTCRMGCIKGFAKWAVLIDSYRKCPCLSVSLLTCAEFGFDIFAQCL